MYKGVRTIDKILRGDAYDFTIAIRIHRGLALNLFLFTLVMDELTIDIQDEVLWYMLFADNVISINVIMDGVNS